MNWSVVSANRRSGGTRADWLMCRHVFLLRHIARYAAQKLASDPRAREKAAKVAHVVGGEARQIARAENRARGRRAGPPSRHE